MGSESSLSSKLGCWRIRASALVTLLIFVIFVATTAAELEGRQIFSGEICTFEPESPCPNCTFRWDASDGSPLWSDSAVFKWTAPDVFQSKMVVINLTVTNEGGCTGRDEMEVTIYPVQQVVTGPDSICDGTTALFSANTEFDSYKWEVFDAQGAYVGGFNDTGTSSVSWSPPGPGEYHITLNGGGRDGPDRYQKRVTVLEAPKCAIIAEDVVCPGTTITMETAEDPDYRYWWEASGGTLSSQNSSTVDWTAPEEPGEYTIDLMVSSAIFDCNCVSSKVVTVLACQPEISVLKDCVYEAPVRVGDFVTYTYEVENVGDLPLRDVNLTDVHDWGPSCDPTRVSGDSGEDGVLDPGESWFYECRYQMPNPSDYDQLLTIMSDGQRSGADMALIQRLSRMTLRLEIKLNSMVEMRGRFNFSRAQMVEDEIVLYGNNLTLRNYTDSVTKETLSLAIDEAGVLRRSEYYSPIQDAVLTSEYGPSGKLTSDFYLSMRTNEGLRIEYNTPTAGYKTYTATDYATGDTLITVMNAMGVVISREYRKTPGYIPYKKRVWVHNTVTVTAIGPRGENVTDWDVFSLEIEVPQPNLKITKRADPDPVEAGGVLKYTIDYTNFGDADSTGVVIEETYDDNVTFVSSSPAPDPGTNNKWTIGDLARDVSGSIDIVVQVNSTLESGHILLNRVNITSAENATDEAVIETAVVAPVLVVEKVADPDPVDAGRFLNYTITYGNEGDGVAHGVVIKEIYDEMVEFISSDPLPDSETNDIWSVGNLSANEGGTIRIRAKVQNYVEAGTILNNTVKITCDENRTSNVSINTIVKGPRLKITKTAPSLTSPGSFFNYTITFWNEGTGNATNVTVTDILDENIIYDNDTSPSDPPPNWKNGSEIRWYFGNLTPGQEETIKIKVKVKEDDEISSNVIRNRYKIDSDQTKGDFASVETMIVSSLWINKTAEESEYSAGDEVVYTILYGNAMNCTAGGPNCTAEDVVVVDRLPELAEYLWASPRPSRASGKVLVWEVGNLSSNENGSITLVVKIPERPDVRFDESSSVSGEGFVSIRERLSTDRRPYDLTNRANITGIYRRVNVSSYDQDDIIISQDSSEATINVVEAPGTEIWAVEHGSGYYEEDRIARLNSTNKSISLDKEIFAKRRATTFSLPMDRQLDYNSSWTDRTCAKNRVRSESVAEDYRYAEYIDKRSSFLLDENQTVYGSDAEFLGGMGHVGYLKLDPETGDALMILDEDYHGSFRVEESIDSYGKGVSYEKTAIGEGFVSADHRVDDSQRSFEHGSGHYESDELMATGTIYKDSRMVYVPNTQTAGSLVLNRSSRWHEGMSTRGDEYIISERTSSANYIDKETVVDSSSLSIFGEFEGRQDVKAAVQAGPHEEEMVVIDQTFLGSYKVATSIGIHKAPKYLEPHVNVTKDQIASGEDAVLFRINVTNDGNKPLGPIVVVDLLPPGLVFINSSLRPEIEGGLLTWTILSLPIGGKLTIDLWTGLKGSAQINVVAVTADYDGGVVRAENSCVAIPSGLYLGPEVQFVSENETETEDNATLKGELWSPPDWNLTSDSVVCCVGVSEDGACDQYLSDSL